MPSVCRNRDLLELIAELIGHIQRRLGGDPGIIWVTATTRLNEMLAMCRAELERMAE